MRSTQSFPASLDQVEKKPQRKEIPALAEIVARRGEQTMPGVRPPYKDPHSLRVASPPCSLPTGGIPQDAAQQLIWHFREAVVPPSPSLPCRISCGLLVLEVKSGKWGGGHTKGSGAFPLGWGARKLEVGKRQGRMLSSLLKHEGCQDSADRKGSHLVVPTCHGSLSCKPGERRRKRCCPRSTGISMGNVLLRMLC